MNETWEKIPGHPGYEASSTGQVRSVDRKVYVEQPGRSFWKTVRGQVIQVRMDDDGYRTVNLSLKGHNKFCRVSRLVCVTFHGPCPEGLECLHGPAGKSVDYWDNVSWGTKSQNELNKRRDGVSNCLPVLRSDGEQFDSITEAAGSVRGSEGYLSDKLNGKYPNRRAYGFEWEFV